MNIDRILAFTRLTTETAGRRTSTLNQTSESKTQSQKHSLEPSRRVLCALSCVGAAKAGTG